ncbi:stage III sporulation protein AG [Pueribacillus sp. YX66]|uniref:stage III sporulation protein AG n=1 Tax=Pueribacillus sp. YX66 TaxID=3229242 RepID=UPI00358CE5E8
MKKEEVKNKFKKLFNHPDNKQSNKKLNSYFYLLIGSGIIIMILSNVTSVFQPNDNERAVDLGSRAAEDEEVSANQSSSPSSIMEYEKYYESQLKEILSDVIGVSNVSVKVNVASTEKKVHEKNRRNEKQVTEENDQEGGTRTIENHSIDEEVVIVQDGDNDKPITVASEKPKVTGVIVVAQGAERLQVKQQIIEAVTRFLHVPSHQVSVLPKKIKEE